MIVNTPSLSLSHMLEPVHAEAVSPDRALCLPTFRHFLIVNKTSLSLSLARALSLSWEGRRLSHHLSHLSHHLSNLSHHLCCNLDHLERPDSMARRSSTSASLSTVTVSSLCDTAVGTYMHIYLYVRTCTYAYILICTHVYIYVYM